MRAGWRSSGGVGRRGAPASSDPGGGERVGGLARGAARSSLPDRSPPRSSGMSVTSTARPLASAPSSDGVAASSRQTPGPTMVSTFGGGDARRAPAAAPRRRRARARAWTWACTAVACSCTSTPRSSSRPVTARAGSARRRAGAGCGSSSARVHRSAQRRTGTCSIVATGHDAAQLGGEAVEQHGQPAQRRARPAAPRSPGRRRRPGRGRRPASR